MKPYQLFQDRMENVLPTLAENSIDCVLWDGPYGFGFMGKEWDSFDIRNRTDKRHEYAKNEIVRPGRKTNGFGNALYAGSYDLSLTGNQKFQQWFHEQAKHVYRVMKPGAYLASFGGPRTYHRMACGIEDAGFEIRDCIKWIFASGFPKSHNGEWGGTALKPAYEPILIARKPFEGTVKQNFEKYGTGALNIDACRIDGEPWKFGTQTDISGGGFGTKRPSDGYYRAKNVEGGENGRWPANIIHDGSDLIKSFFPESSGQQGDVKGSEPSNTGDEGTNCFGKFNRVASRPKRNDSGTAARFFQECQFTFEEDLASHMLIYCAKTSKTDRNEGCEHLTLKPSGMVSNTSGQHITRKDIPIPQNFNNHPTVKPTALGRYLVRLLCPKRGTTLDPNQGSGSFGKAAIYEHCTYIGIDMDFDIEIARARIEFALNNRDNQIKIFA